ncbi:hypothetical protein GCM10011534_00180 [Pseudooceanicola nanhaiensis]|uniref:Uncharacterized protein n=1 Tax=Pseudooceanicola nanhaiensis TaxID=375761 RepID=A0A917W9Q4_9RHOB|nr:hypothetical protein GCM10011534_00180 [Pseudooceanicola nanhaiensis]
MRIIGNRSPDLSEMLRAAYTAGCKQAERLHLGDWAVEGRGNALVAVIVAPRPPQLG